MHEHHHNEINSIEQVKTLLEYMYNHNSSHTAELEKISQKLKECGKDGVYNDVVLAMEKYKEGNALLAAALEKVSD